MEAWCKCEFTLMDPTTAIAAKEGSLSARTLAAFNRTSLKEKSKENFWLL
jgi:hypothetical protein